MLIFNKISDSNQVYFNHTGLPRGTYYVRLKMGIDTVTKTMIIK
jgi:hypothetical protein